MSRVAPLAFSLALTGVGCREVPSDAERDGSGGDAVASLPDEERATVERCGPGFRGQMITPRGEVLQYETAQTTACTEGCGRRTAALMFARHFAGTTCDEVRRNITGKPVMDVWGAQVRVICNGDVAQAISGGRDGKIGTCDDIANLIPVSPDSVSH